MCRGIVLLISIHVPTRGTTEEISLEMARTGISIHVPTRGTTAAFAFCDPASLYFNPRSHEGNDPAPTGTALEYIHFNPRSHEGNDCVGILTATHSRYFNPRSHEGNDVGVDATCSRSDISIHVPTRGTTAFLICVLIRLSISIHVPTRGTTSDMAFPKSGKKFQSTFPRGERPLVSSFASRRPDISIHVPTRGTTGTSSKSQQSLLFQSTFPRGERRSTTNYKLPQFEISIHVPTRGTTAIFPNFRENIFLNTVNLYISFSFSCYTTIISLLFIHFCALFMVRIPIYFYVRFIFAHKSHNKNTVRRNSSIDPYMFYFGFILIPQIVKSQTIYFFIYNIR